MHTISTHALREEGDVAGRKLWYLPAQFLPTPSARRATGSACVSFLLSCISTHALREEGDAIQLRIVTHERHISTHALREEGDLRYMTPPHRRGKISTHALREEGDSNFVYNRSLGPQFLPTPSARRATRKHKRALARVANFYPRPPRGGRQPNAFMAASTSSAISTHALREEGDSTISVVVHKQKFLPTPSARRATSCRSVMVRS